MSKWQLLPASVTTPARRGYEIYDTLGAGYTGSFGRHTEGSIVRYVLCRVYGNTWYVRFALSGRMDNERSSSKKVPLRKNRLRHHFYCRYPDGRIRCCPCHPRTLKRKHSTAVPLSLRCLRSSIGIRDSITKSFKIRHPALQRSPATTGCS